MMRLAVISPDSRTPNAKNYAEPLNQRQVTTPASSTQPPPTTKATLRSRTTQAAALPMSAFGEDGTRGRVLRQDVAAAGFEDARHPSHLFDGLNQLCGPLNHGRRRSMPFPLPGSRRTRQFPMAWTQSLECDPMKSGAGIRSASHPGLSAGFHPRRSAVMKPLTASVSATALLRINQRNDLSPAFSINPEVAVQSEDFVVVLLQVGDQRPRIHDHRWHEP